MFSELIKGHSIEMGKGISGWVAAHKRPMINAEPALDLVGIQGDFSFLTDALVVPIAHEDEILGTLTLYAQDPISYGEHDLDTLQMLATLLAPLISESQKGEIAASEHAVDPITRIHRISYLTAIGPQLISFANKNKSPLSLIYFEISNLSKIIRIFGSNTVDSVLPKIASYIRSEIRESDILVRYGHQGFVALMPGVRNDQALRCIERLKLQISREFVDMGQRFSVDLKAGAAFYPKDGVTVFGLLQSAQESIRSEASEDDSSDDNILDFIPRI
jgi:diguanylate cyclase (GGDEF)-like protein